MLNNQDNVPNQFFTEGEDYMMDDSADGLRDSPQNSPQKTAGRSNESQ